MHRQIAADSGPTALSSPPTRPFVVKRPRPNLFIARPSRASCREHSELAPSCLILNLVPAPRCDWPPSSSDCASRFLPSRRQQVTRVISSVQCTHVLLSWLLPLVCCRKPLARLSSTHLSLYTSIPQTAGLLLNTTVLVAASVFLSAYPVKHCLPNKL